ncbi:MAG: lipase maturation factor family protein, partial [Candidatus Acidiferrales bacterium]
MPEPMLSKLAWPLAPGPNHLIPRWVVLRGLGLIYFSAFYSCAFQIQGLIGPNGILPVSNYLQELAQHFSGFQLYWYAPTLLWFAHGARALTALWVVGMAASLLLVLNIWPRGMLAICFAAFLSFITAAQDFSSYQSDGMLLEAGFIALFFAPPGFRPGLGAARPPSRLSYFLLQWEWFRIYFESGLVKLLSGDPEWRHLTAMDEYYQNGPLPTWIGWYVERLPHWFHAATAGGTLALELILVGMMFLPRRWRIVLFCIVTPWEMGIILTANYALLNYLVLLLGVLLLDDRLLAPLVEKLPVIGKKTGVPIETIGARDSQSPSAASLPTEEADSGNWLARVRPPLRTAVRVAEGFFLGWIFYATTALLIAILVPGNPPPMAPVTALEPSRIANRFGLFAVMTRGRYEIEFQGSRDGKTWTAYP